jgi:hypothetical protein
MKKLFLMLLVPSSVVAAPFEISDDYAATAVQPDHFVVRCDSSAPINVPVTKDSANGNLLYFRYDISGMTAAQVLTCTVTAANNINQESASSPFGALPPVPAPPANARVVAQ